MVVVLVTTAIAVLLAGIAMLTQDLLLYRRSWVADLSTEARILALSTAPAIAFDDEAGAERNLAALQPRTAVLAAAVYATNGNLYSAYVRPGEPPPPAHLSLPADGTRVDGDRMELTQRIVRNGETLGTIYLRARYDVLDRVEGYISIFALVTLICMGVALALSNALQKSITEPLRAMTTVARQIVDRRDYSLRVGESTRDEIGIVIDAFNGMLDEVQLRSQALEQSNSALQNQVAVRQAAEAALTLANARLESTMAVAEIGGWTWDLVDDVFTADKNLAALFGVEDERRLSGPPGLHHRQIHPDDLAAVVAAKSAAIAGGGLVSVEFRVVWPDGTVRWMACRGKVQFDARHRPVLMAGLLIDITGQKSAEEAVRASENLYRAIGESIDFGVWVAAPDGRNIYASESYLRLIGISQEQCSNFGWSDFVHPDDAAGTMAAWLECVRTGSPWYREHRVRGRDGQYHPILAQGVPIRADDGGVSGWAGINLDISRLKRTEQALIEADQRKDEFLATLAHELRNPLAPIRHAAKLLDAAGADEAQRKWGRDVIARQVHRMALLLDDLLDVSRITRRRLELKRDRVSLESLVSSAVETARPLLEAKGHDLDISLPAEPVELNVDPLRLSQVLSNLLTNAAKYTDAGGRIALAAVLTPEELQIRVSDNGIGLAPAAIPNLFEIFSQVESALDRAEGGLGIGLALVKGLVSLHGGRVDVSSAGLGLGSTFTITLPRHIVTAQGGTVERPPAARAETALRCKVLVADDNRDAADSLAIILELSGYEVLVAHTGRQALDIGTRERPDAVILDIGMPDMNGYEVARHIRGAGWGSGVFLLAMTGWGQSNDKERARAAGFDQHLTKPVDVEQVESSLGAFLQQRGARDRPARRTADR
jgi:PAS domain S-box-containing protein